MWSRQMTPKQYFWAHKALCVNVYWVPLNAAPAMKHNGSSIMISRWLPHFAYAVWRKFWKSWIIFLPLHNFALFWWSIYLNSILNAWKCGFSNTKHKTLLFFLCSFYHGNTLCVTGCIWKKSSLIVSLESCSGTRESWFVDVGNGVVWMASLFFKSKTRGCCFEPKVFSRPCPGHVARRKVPVSACVWPQVSV